MNREPGRNPLPFLYVIGFSATSSIQIVSPLTSLFAIHYLGASIAEVGYIIAAFFIASMLTKLPLAFSRGERKMPYLLFLSGILMSISPLAYAASFSPTVLFVARFIHGVGFSLLAASGLSLVTLMSVRGMRGRAINRYTSFIALGLVVGPAISSASLMFVGVRETLMLSSLVASPIVFCAFLILKKSSLHLAETPSRTERSARKVGTVFRNGSFQMSFLSYFSFAFIYGVFLSYVPVYLKQEYVFPNYLVTAAFFGYFAATALSRFFVNKAQEKMGGQNTLITALLTASILGIVIFVVRTPATFTGSFILMGLSHGIVFPVTAIIVMRAIEPSSLLLANSMFLLAFDLGTTFGPVLTSSIAANYGILTALLVSVMPSFCIALAQITGPFVRKNRK